jgi:hypothetical protein
LAQESLRDPAHPHSRYSQWEKAMQKSNLTIGQWLDIFMDLDAYIAKGGRLLELPIAPLEELSPDVRQLIIERMGHQRIDRIGRFYARCGTLVRNGDVPIGRACTEDDLRTVWRETAGSSSPSTESLH